MDHVSMMRRAKEKLAGNWLNAAVATLIMYAILGLAGCTYVGELLVYGPLAFGYILYLMALTDTRTSDFGLLFKGFNRFVETMVAGLLYSLIVGIGSIFLVVPGIIAACGFAMTFFIMSEDANISGLDALKASWQMMKGHKWDFFCFQFRFIGWGLLCLLTCGIGFLWLYPYIIAANFNYYRQLRYGTF